MNAPMSVQSGESVSVFRESVAQEREGGFGAIKTARGNLPLLAVSVNAKIVGLCAEVQIEQIFRNGHDEPLEATYIFPLPDRAATNRLVMNVAGREILGVLKERGVARQEFDRAIATGHRAAIAEEERPSVFTMRVGNIMPREVARVTLVMTVPLTFEDGEGTFRFPLVVAPRYIPSQALSGGQAGDGVASDTDAVPDASRISPPVLLPGMSSPVRLAINIDVDPAGLPLSSVRSSLHAIYTSGSAIQDGRGLGAFSLSLVHQERLDRDFVLRLAFTSDALVTTAACAPTSANRGIFRVTFMPPSSLMRAVKPKDVIFVLDQSGSMSGWKMVAARRAVARMVDTLTSEDRFNVYAFDDQITTPTGWTQRDLMPATDRNRFAAVEFLATVESRGGTEMAAPLAAGCSALLARREPERERVLVLVTDGQVGNEDQIIASLSADLQHIRAFTVGIDRAVNEGFLRRLAIMGAGAMELVEGETRLDEAMDRIHRKLGTPLLTDVRIHGEGMDIDAASITPDRIAAVFAGCPLEVSGRYTEHAALERSAIVITATDATGRRFSQSLAPQRTSNPAIGRMWARSRVRALEDRYTANGGTQQLEDDLVNVSLEFSVLCRFTAFVAVDNAEIVNRGGRNHRITQAVEAPSGWDQEGGGGGRRSDKDMSSAQKGGAIYSKAEAPMAEEAMEMSEIDDALNAPVFDRAPPAAASLPQTRASSPKRDVEARRAQRMPDVGRLASSAVEKLKQGVSIMSKKPAAPAPKREAPRAKVAPEPMDLSAYARLADELVQMARSLDLTNANAVALFMIRARALVEDLLSLSLGDEQVDTLKQQFHRFEDAYAKIDIGSSAAKSTLEALREALLVFSATTTGPAQPGKQRVSRQGFWKRSPRG